MGRHLGKLFEKLNTGLSCDRIISLGDENAGVLSKWAHRCPRCVSVSLPPKDHMPPGCPWARERGPVLCTRTARQDGDEPLGSAAATVKLERVW